MPTNSTFVLRSWLPFAVMLQRAEQRMLRRHRATLMFRPKYCGAVPIAILIPQTSIATPHALRRSFVMEKTFLFLLRRLIPEGFSPWWQMELKAVSRPLWLPPPLQCIAWGVIPFPSLSRSTQMTSAHLRHAGALFRSARTLQHRGTARLLALPPVPASPPCFPTFT